MEHTDKDIKAVDYGNFWLDKLMSMPEDEFYKMLVKNVPAQHCLSVSTYETMVKMNSIRIWPWNENFYTDDMKETVNKASEILPNGSNNEKKRLAMCIYVLGSLAEKRLQLTIGI